MLASLQGVPGRLKALLDRLTAARANNLDNLDVPVSGRAPASTALSSATWTNARAALLDSISSIVSVTSSTSTNVGTLLGRLTAARAANLDSVLGIVADSYTEIASTANGSATHNLGRNYDRSRTYVKASARFNDQVRPADFAWLSASQISVSMPGISESNAITQLTLIEFGS